MCVCVCVCVCVSVCLSARISPEPHALSLPIFPAVAYGCGSVVLQQGDEIPRESDFEGFLPH